MLTWSLAFFLVAIVAGILGYGGVAIARIFFFVFLALFILAAGGHMLRRQSHRKSTL